MKLPLQDNHFNLVHSTGLLEHFSDKEILQLLSECKRVLKPNSNIMMLIPNLFSPEIIWRMIKNKGKGTERSFSKNKLINLFNKARFHSIKVEGAHASVLPSFIDIDNLFIRWIEKYFFDLDYLTSIYAKN